MANYGDAALSTRYAYRAVPPIHIIVKNGHITLKGWLPIKWTKALQESCRNPRERGPGSVLGDQQSAGRRINCMTIWLNL